MAFRIPLLLIAWRRPHTIRQVINAIRPVAPTRIFIACDGPNPDRPGEFEKVAATRNVLDTEIDWHCTIHRLYSDVNLGCRMGVSQAISWFFCHNDEGIILEDDCVPHPDFFPFCASLLERYRFDTRVWSISGSNFQDGHWRGDGSYYFSRYTHCWGWATWRRCWNHYDQNVKQWPRLKSSSLQDSAFLHAAERDYWTRILDHLFYNKLPDTWDYQWSFICRIHSALCCISNVNLVSNVGFDADATHTFTPPETIPTLEALGHVVHPPFILPDLSADVYTFDNHYCGKELQSVQTEKDTLRTRARRLARRLIDLRNYQVLES